MFWFEWTFWGNNHKSSLAIIESTMLENSFEKFREVVLCDATLQKMLQKPVREDVFIEDVVRLGAERGFGFTADEVRDAMRESRRVWVERWI